MKGVYICFSAEDVVDALQDAVSQGAKAGNVRILGEGHCYENFVYSTATEYIIDISGMREIQHDAIDNVTSIGAGQTNWDVAVVLQKQYNLQLPAGSCYSVGLGGHVTGGGYGLSSRAYGLTIDYLSAVEIVVPSGNKFHTITANKESNNDLFVALRGAGGGNFGVITKYFFANLPNAFQNADLFAIAIDWKEIKSANTLKAILDLYALYCTNVGDSTTIADQSWSKNIFCLGKFTHKSASQFAFIIQSAWNTKDEQETQTQQIYNFVSQLSKIPDVSPTHLRSPVAGYPSLVPGMYGGHMKSFVLPSNAATQSMSWINATMNNNGSGPNQRGVYNSVYFRTKLTDIQIQAMFDYLGGSKDEPTLNYSQTLLQLDSYGGQINKYNGNDTSIKQRSSIMKGQFQTYWNNGYDNADELDSQYINWQKEFFTAMFAETGGFPDPDYIPPSGHPDPVKAKASVDGCYVNYPNGILGTNGGTPSIDHALKLYFGDAITKRLMSTKNSYRSE